MAQGVLQGHYAQERSSGSRPAAPPGRAAAAAAAAALHEEVPRLTCCYLQPPQPGPWRPRAAACPSQAALAAAPLVPHPGACGPPVPAALCSEQGLHGRSPGMSWKALWTGRDKGAADQQVGQRDCVLGPGSCAAVLAHRSP